MSTRTAADNRIYAAVPLLQRLVARALIALVAGALFACALVAGQGQGVPRKPGVNRAQRLRPGNAQAHPVLSPDAQRAMEVMQLFLNRGAAQPFIGEQTTVVVGRSLVSTQTVKHQGPGIERMDFMTPKRMNGDIFLQNGNRTFHFMARQRVIREGHASMDMFQGHARQIVQGINTGRIAASVVGSQVVAGQNASIVEIHTANGGWRLWIDDRTGVRLKSEQLNARGSVIQQSYFNTINYSPTFAPNDFAAESLPSVPHEDARPLVVATVAEAQQHVAYTIREPALPAGFRLIGVSIVQKPGERKITVLRYTDGPNSLTLYQQPFMAGNNSMAQLRQQPHTLHAWIAARMAFVLVGNLPTDAVRQIVDSLQ
jgi:hypothetical protein